jgi:hypothetical protein
MAVVITCPMRQKLSYATGYTIFFMPKIPVFVTVTFFYVPS